MIVNIIGGCEHLWISQSDLNALFQKYLSVLDPKEDELHSGATTCGICAAASAVAKRFGLRIEGYTPSVAIEKGIIDLSCDRITIIKGTWGDEILPCIDEFERRGKNKYLTICFNGGDNTKRFAEELISRNFAIILVAGSRRAADELIGIYAQKQNVFAADVYAVKQMQKIILGWKLKR